MQIAYFPAFAFNPATCDDDIWIGNMTLAAARKRGLKIDASYPLYGDEKLSDADGVAFKAPVPHVYG